MEARTPSCHLPLLRDGTSISLAATVSVPSPPPPPPPDLRTPLVACTRVLLVVIQNVGLCRSHKNCPEQLAPRFSALQRKNRLYPNLRLSVESKAFVLLPGRHSSCPRRPSLSLQAGPSSRQPLPLPSSYVRCTTATDLSVIRIRHGQGFHRFSCASSRPAGTDSSRTMPDNEALLFIIH